MFIIFHVSFFFKFFTLMAWDSILNRSTDSCKCPLWTVK